MSLTIEIVSDPELGGFTARLPDVPAYGEGEKGEAIADCKKLYSNCSSTRLTSLNVSV